MDYNQFAEKIKAKYPDYAGMDNRELAEKTIAKHPEYTDQVTFDAPGPGIFDAVKAAAGPLLTAASPSLPVIGDLAQAYNAQKIGETAALPGQWVGDKVTAGATKAGVPKLLAKGLGFGTSVALDPMTYAGGAGGKLAGEVAAEGTTDAVKTAMPTIFQKLAGIPEAATDALLRTKDLLKRFAGSPESIETAVDKLRSTMKNVLAKEGEELGKVKELVLQLPNTLDGQVTALLGKDAANAAGAGKQGYGRVPTAEALPADIMAEWQALKATLGTFKNPLDKLHALVDLQERVGDITTFAKKGLTKITGSENGALNGIYKDLAERISEIPGGSALAAVKAKYSKARVLYDTLQPYLQDPGKAEVLLEKVFTSDSPGYRTIREGLATIEKLSGEPVMTDLFNQFAASKLKAGMGKGGGLTIATALGSAATAMGYKHPITAMGLLAAGAAGTAAQSPRVLSTGLQAAQGLAPAFRGAAATAGTAMGVAVPTGLNAIRRFLAPSAENQIRENPAQKNSR